MGQEYSLFTLLAASANLDVPELSDISYEKSLGSSRFMKCVRAKHPDGLVVAKLVVKPYVMLNGGQVVQDVGGYVKVIKAEQAILSEIPNALSYHRLVETAANGYLVRQFIRNSLYDRLSTRPFLEDIEKKWLAFQLLCALRDCHARKIFHGDVKTENVLITSSNWLYLTDFSSSYKPTYLPGENPANFSFYFDNSGRQTCYIAPERFLDKGQIVENDDVTAAMDIFSAGCVIAELFLEVSIFSLGHIFGYRRDEYDPLTQVNLIPDKDIRDLVAHMIQLKPEDRYSADKYLKEWRLKAFPAYFDTFLHEYMYMMVDPTTGKGPITNGAKNLGESDNRIERVYHDFDKISYALGYRDTDENEEPEQDSTSNPEFFPLHIDVPHPRHRIRKKKITDSDDGTLIFLNLIISSIRSTARTTSRIQACDLLLAFAERVTDETKLDRILPYVVSLFTDNSDSVRVAALRTVTQLTAMVKAISPVNSYLFPDYLLPRLQVFLLGHSSRPSASVRSCYASCISTLATTASRYLDLAHALYSDKSAYTSENGDSKKAFQVDYRSLYDSSRLELVKEFEEQTKIILSDHDSSVRRACLGSVAPLCVFFGSSKAIDMMLQHMNTYLNDKDWMLKCAFFETIVAVGAFVGCASLEEFTYPLMIRALDDPEEFVIERVIRSLNSLARLGLFQRRIVLESLESIFKFTMHPNLWIRDAACNFVASASTYLTVADFYTVVIPPITPYIRFLPTNKTHIPLLSALKPPLSRFLLDRAVTWASSGEKSLFWQASQEPKNGGPTLIEEVLRRYNPSHRSDSLFDSLPMSDQDKRWVEKLRNQHSMTKEDEQKLLVLHQFIREMVQRKPKGNRPSTVNEDLYPPGFNLPVQTVTFTPIPSLFPLSLDFDKSPHLDLLVDQLSITDDPIGRRKLSHFNRARERLPTLDGTEGQTSPASIQAPGGGLDGAPLSSGGQRTPALLEPPGPNQKTVTISHERMRRYSSDGSVAARDDLASLTSGNRQPFKVAKSPLAVARELQKKSPNEIRYRATHSYKGQDPYVLRLLDSLYLQNYPVDDDEFGPRVVSAGRQVITRANGVQPTTPWKPQSVLVAVLSEHTAAVNRIAVATDHSFFISGSDDGTVKVWDTSRLERHVSYKSRLSWNMGAGVKVTALTFIEQTCTFVCSGSDGTISVIRIDPSKPRMSRFGKLRVVRQYTLPDEQSVIWMEHHRTEKHSTLLMLTTKCRLIALDLKDLTVLYTLQNPLRYGRATCFCVDRNHHWALVGSDQGVLTLWDLRFLLLVKSWAFQPGAPIHQLGLAPVRGSKKNWVFVAGGTVHGEVTVWDLESGRDLETVRELETVRCKEIYQPHTAKNAPDDSYNLHDITNSDHTLLTRFKTFATQSGPTDNFQEAQALAIGAHVPVDGSDARRYFVVSAGTDWKIRFWDPSRSDSSMLVSGLEAGQEEPTYVSQVVNMPVSNREGSRTTDVLVVTEEFPAAQSSNVTFGRSMYKRPVGKSTYQQQHHLLRGHLDMVTDVALVENPYGMIVSADRSGVIFVFA